MVPRAYQQKSIEHLLRRTAAGELGLVDASDTGTGKTVVTAAVLRELDRATLVVCPRAVRPGWARTAAALGTEFDIANYEAIRTGNTLFGRWEKVPHRVRPRWVWAREIKQLVFDEVHRCRGANSPRITESISGGIAQNADMLRAARRQGIPVIGLSATMADDPFDLDALGYVLGLHDGEDKETLRKPDPLSFYRWAVRHGCGAGAFSSFVFKGTSQEKLSQMARIHAKIFPDKGVRVRISDLPDFPETQITAELYDLEGSGQIDEIYAKMAPALAALEARAADDIPGILLTEILREREKIELLKVPLFVDLAEADIAAGRSVVLFFNFTSSINEACRMLGTDCLIDGRQIGERGARDREHNRLRFQRDASRVIVVNGDAGGVGLDLHDVESDFPRSVYNSPGYNAKIERQKMGRVRRDGGKSKSLQRFVFIAGTIEERVHRSVSGKLDRMDSLNDADLNPCNLPILGVEKS